MDPSPVSCIDVDQNLWRYIDRELSASSLAAISSHLRSCESCQGLYHERARDASHYRMVFVDSPFGEPFVVKLKRRLREVAPSSAGGGSSRRRQTGLFSLRNRKVRRALAVAAMLVLIPIVILIGFLQKSSERRWLGYFEAKNQGKVSLIPEDGGRHTGTSSLTLQARGSYGPGQALDVPRGVTVALDHGRNRITLQGPAFLRVDPSATRDRFVAYLEKGKLGAEVAPLTGDHQAFIIRTKQAVASVVGTRFQVEARKDGTFLEVQEGTVKFQCASALPGDHVRVHSGERFRMRADAAAPEQIAGRIPEESPSRVAADPAPGAPPPGGFDPEPSAAAEAQPDPVESPGEEASPPAESEPRPGPAKADPGSRNHDLDQPVTR